MLKTKETLQNSGIKYSLPILLIAFLLLILFAPVAFSDDAEKFVVVIDAGHGGSDPGALGSFSKEKDVALAIALKLGGYIEELLPDVQVIYTRKGDSYPTLDERASIANKNNADLFLSIHLNANNSSSPYGTETYVMGLHVTESNLKVAQRENAVILKEDNYTENYDGFNPNSPEAYILFSLYQNTYLDQSISFASKIQDQFEKRVGRKNRGVHQAGFLVLYKTTMPSVLIETGFITNKAEEKFLNSEQGQDYMASAIYRAFRGYKEEVTARRLLEESKDEKPEEEQQQIDPIKEEGREIEQSSTQETTAEKVAEKTEDNGKKVAFRIQIAIVTKPLDENNPKLLPIKNQLIVEDYQDKYLKCMVGDFYSLEEAIEKQHFLQGIGFEGAFVVAYYNKERISLKKAKELIKN